MTLLGQLGTQLPERYYLGIDAGYREHVSAVISLKTFAESGERWKRARCVHVASTRAGLCQLQAYLDGFCQDRQAFLGLCEPTGGYYAATVFQYLLSQGYAVHLVENAAVRHKREQLFGGLPKTDEMDARVLARIGYLHEAVGEECRLRPLQLQAPDQAELLALCRDHWKLTSAICRARNQFTQLMAVVFPELKSFYVSSVSSAAPVKLMSVYLTPAQLAAAPAAEIVEVLCGVGDVAHAKRVAELQALAQNHSGLLPDPSRAWRLEWLTHFLLDACQEQTQLERQIQRVVMARGEYQRLASLPMSGPATLAWILAATGDVRRFANDRQYVAYTGYFAGLERSQTIDRTRMSKRGNRDMKRALFLMAAPLVWLDRGDNAYKALYARKVAEGRPWYSAMPFVCAALARHIYHCLKSQERYDAAKAFRRSALPPARSQAAIDLRASLDERFEVLNAYLSPQEE